MVVVNGGGNGGCGGWFVTKAKYNDKYYINSWRFID